MKTMIHWLLTALLGVGIGYVLLVCGMYVFQRQLTYFPDANIPQPAAAGLPEANVVETQTADGETLKGWFLPAQDDRPTILYLHGNTGNLTMRAGKLAAFAGRGFGVLALHYRGYGGSSGSPSEKGLYEDARAAWKFLADKGLGASQVMVYGESLGTGVAVQLASEVAPKALVLEAPYTSVVERGQEIYWFAPISRLVKDKFESIQKIAAVHAPLVVVHGEKDEVIPAHHGRRLFEAANEPKQAIFLPEVGHTDFPLDALVEAVELAARGAATTPEHGE